MDIDIKQVQRLCASSAIIEQQVNILLKTIQSSILEATKEGMTKVSVPIPTNFNTSGISNKNAQIIIYDTLINEIESKGFTVEIIMTDNSVDYLIGWDLEDNNTDLSSMSKNIAQHIKKKDNPKSKKAK